MIALCMKYIYKIYLFSLLFSPFSGYSQIPEVIPFNDIRKSKEQVHLSSFGKKIDYIKLETNDDCIIGKVSWCKRIEDKIVILEKSTKLYYIFDNSGKFLSKIGKVGKGPLEYLSNERGTSIDFENEIICIYDRGKNSYLEYDLIGNCIKEFKVENNPEHVIRLDNNYIFFHPLVRRAINDWYVLSIVSLEGKLVKKVKKDSLSQRYLDAYRQFYRYGDEIHFWETQNDTIFSFDGVSVKPEFVIDLGKYKMPNELWFDFANIDTRGSMYAVVLSIFETHNYLLFAVKDLENKGKFVLWDKKAHSGSWVGRDKEYGRVGFGNDLDGGPLFIPGFMFSQNQIGQALDVYTLKEQLENGLIKPLNKELVDFIESSAIDDNPILQIVELK